MEITYKTGQCERDARYSVRHWTKTHIVERWFPTRDDRTAYLVSERITQRHVLTWEDPADDFNGTNIYMDGKDIR
jgi:hypothetical protein